ncbi:HK97 gp10 family phage protein [Dehalobacter sp. TeCB1]|uniref:HK97 gp10 family phage protein n=1 Tax=Dehalobacter sp. TeCB1 TaxID=1843715 RepID=UPI00083A97DE|nr:HK97 gp10 family phage protein [Dehalobacter sp. TeCB1]OCZ53796.1 hypothetical protein A7D23_07490 [Dehalobacter sp. TeCB1]
MTTSYEFRGLDEWEDDLDRLARELPQELERFLLRLAYDLQNYVKQKTPVETGYLRNSWQIGEVTRQGKALQITVYTNVEYALYVENGHRQTKRKVPITARDGTVTMVTLKERFIEGKHMMQLSIDELEAVLPARMQRLLEDVMA